jgi:hypothetical protein
LPRIVVCGSDGSFARGKQTVENTYFSSPS